MKFVREQFYLAATAQNLKRLARYLKSRTGDSGEGNRDSELIVISIPE